MPRKLRFFSAGILLLNLLSAAAPVRSETENFVLKGTVVALSGTVKFRNERTILWQDVIMGQEFSKGDQIRTESDGQVSIEFNNGNFLALKGDSAVTIEELHADPGTGEYDAIFSTIKARLKAEVNDRENLRTFEIRTPTAVAGVRGTIFFLNVAERLTEILVERGLVNMRYEGSGSQREIAAGFVVSADDQGEIGEPGVPDPEKLEEFKGFLEPGARRFFPPPPPPDGFLPPPEEGAILTEDQLALELENNLIDLEQQQQQSLLDQQLSQEADKTDYILNPPPPTGSNLADADGDGLLNSVDPDDDNDFLLDSVEIAIGTNPLSLDTDADALTDWEEDVLVNSDPLTADSDGDGIDDGGDTFPNEASIFEPMSNVRTWRYNKIDTISGLRAEISTMLASSAERQRDFVMDRISDAQLHKVLKDRNGNWVRYEEYIFRPTPTEIGALTITYKSGGQISSLNWSMDFNTSLNALTSQQIRNLPWDKFFSLTPNYGATQPAFYPTLMSVELERAAGSRSIEERRTLNPPAFSGSWQQGIASDQLSIDNDAFGPFTTINLISSNPAAFDYDRAGTVVDFFVYVVNDADGTLAAGSFNYTSLWEVVGTNLAGFESIGAGQHLEIQSNYPGPVQIDVVYVPMSELLWRGDPDWPQLLSW